MGFGDCSRATGLTRLMEGTDIPTLCMLQAAQPQQRSKHTSRTD
eukprot:CAMPEP_0170648624 /NCGR_PEP_ID=MMETSP0224-20130122/44834_1 /TAXON_ID=285029 /ORGANISM="Togula jolla, Strain CCCM 725" /LENGTH=43 /DNA_ID= /DNA_START= /DNA_END= /DNA_ORIENTATION=